MKKMKNTLIIAMIVSSLSSSVAIAADPWDDCQHWTGFTKYCEDGDYVAGSFTCDLHGAGTSTAWHDNIPVVCRTDVTDYNCNNGKGMWIDQGDNKYVCDYPKYKFYIYNDTAYTVSMYGFSGDYSGPYKPGYDFVHVNTASGEKFQTDPGMPGDSQTAKEKDGVVGKFRLYSSIYSIDPDYPISGSDMIADNPDNPQYFTLRSTANDYHDKQFKNLACIIKTNKSSWSDQKNQIGSLYLYPNILEAKVNFCVSLATRASEAVQYQFKLNDFNSIETADTKLYPSIDDQTEITPISPSTSLGIVNFSKDQGGTQCISTPLYFKTQHNDCQNLITNSQSSAINSASMNISVTDPSGHTHYMTLRPAAKIQTNDSDVVGLYTLTLTSDENNISLTPSDAGDKNSSRCDNGVCKTEVVTYNPQS
ncbi:hypothetical protein [Cysteiniphilum sp. QT6929]|uniref:hypothetical protein n=1 Tax=Cysteiniphilum sp. QT6929 TaxID=2975055 RepID=UPI0024B327D2|nr:hypothetical protein [Cysteiniphilum sp. QT6929]WHN66021.1 hypothetical protein NYP54_01980 [Cysteiniphilum sp. QT6929]